MTDLSPATPSRVDRLRCEVQRLAHLLPKQGPIGVFVHHNTLHAFEDLPFEDAVRQAGQLFGAEPYMSEANYRAELGRGRIQLVDVDAVLDQEPDSVIFAGLSRSSLRRAMITPGVREFDAATIVWRAEQGDLASLEALASPTLVTERDEFGRGALARAAEAGRAPAVELLLRRALADARRLPEAVSPMRRPGRPRKEPDQRV